MDDRDDPYDILGVSKDATESQIKSAYRKLALQHHPDKQTSEDAKQVATERFAKISNAYEILGDAERRREYDRPSSSNFGGNDDFFHHDFHQRFHDPFDVFAEVFGEEFGSQRRGFYSDPFTMRGSMFGGGDPFFGGGSMFGGSMFGSFERMQQQMRQQQEEMMRMRQQQEDLMRGSGQFNNSGGGSNYYYSSSSSTSNIRHSGQGSESVTTSTRMINGKRQTVTERVVTKPDGTVERHVETTGDDDFPQVAQDDPFFGRLENDRNHNQRQLEQGSAHGEESASKKRRFFNKRKSSKKDDGKDDSQPWSRY